MEKEEIKNRIGQFLTKSLKDADIDSYVDLFSTGLVTSLLAMQLVLFVEKEFRVIMDNTDLDLNNFRTVNSITNLVLKKLNGTS